MSQGYAVTSALTGLFDTAFTWSSAYTTNRRRLNDGIMDELAASASSAQASGQTLVINMGGATALVGFALLNHNLASGACTVRVRAATDAAITAGVVTAKDATTIVTAEPNQKDTVLQFPSVTKQYWELTFVHTGTKIVTVGEVLAFASITTLTRHTVYGDGEDERYVLNRSMSKTGHQRSTYVGGPVRTKRLPFKDLNAAEKLELRTLWAATKGGNANLLWLEYIESTATAATDAAQECLWGKIQEDFSWTQDDFRLFNYGGFVIVGQGREVGS
jgi:hypothetical protein